MKNIIKIFGLVVMLTVFSVGVSNAQLGKDCSTNNNIICELEPGQILPPIDPFVPICSAFEILVGGVCIERPSPSNKWSEECKAMGYNMTFSQCLNRPMIKCPLDVSKVFCAYG